MKEPTLQASQTLAHTTVLLSALARHLPAKYAVTVADLLNLSRYVLARNEANLRNLLDELDGYKAADEKDAIRFGEAVHFVFDVVPQMSVAMSLTIAAVIDAYLVPIVEAQAPLWRAQA